MVINIPNVVPCPGSKRGGVVITNVGERLGAVKWFRSSVSLERRLKELKILLNLQNHSNIVDLLAVGPDCEINAVEFMVTEFTAEGDLEHLLHSRSSVSYNFANALLWMKQLADALTFLHDRAQPIIHRDIKPSNCLLFNKGTRLKICDFGSAESTHLPGPLSPTRRGTAGFMPPELFDSPTVSSTPTYTTKGDVFAAAMTYWEILTRRRICPIDQPLFVSLIHLRERRRPARIRGCPAFLWRLLEISWANDPKQRPEMRAVSSLFCSIQTHIIDVGLIPPPLVIPPPSDDPPTAESVSPTSEECWEVEEDEEPSQEPVDHREYGELPQLSASPLPSIENPVPLTFDLPSIQLPPSEVSLPRNLTDFDQADPVQDEQKH